MLPNPPEIMHTPLPTAAYPSLLPLAHAGMGTTPVPHWVVLVGGVVCLWVVIGGGVVVLDGLLARFADR